MKHTIDMWGEKWSEMTGRLNVMKEREEALEEELEKLREEIGNLYEERRKFDEDFKMKRKAELLEVLIGMEVLEAAKLCRADYEISIQSDSSVVSGDRIIIVKVKDGKIISAQINE